MFAPFHYAFVQRGLLELVLLAAGAGLLGTWIVVRGLAFYSHAVGTAAFPGPVLVDGLALGAPLHALLLGLVALAVTAALSAVGALLVAALFVVPAATTRLWLRRLASWQLATVALVLVEGVVGLWLSVELNVPPGAAIAIFAGGVFAVAAAARAARGTRLLALAGVVLLTGCGVGSHARAGAPTVVATTTQIGDWARQVGGGDVDVHQILAPNTDPHEYEPRPSDVEATAGAKLVLENGDELDHWMSRVVSQAGGHPAVVVLGDRVPVKLPGESSGPEKSRFNPHWWHDPRN